MTRFRNANSGDLTPTELRVVSPEVAQPEPDPIDSWSLGAFVVGAVFSLLGFAAMVVGLVGYFTGSR